MSVSDYQNISAICGRSRCPEWGVGVGNTNCRIIEYLHILNNSVPSHTCRTIEGVGLLSVGLSRRDCIVFFYFFPVHYPEFLRCYYYALYLWKYVTVKEEWLLDTSAPPKQAKLVVTISSEYSIVLRLPSNETSPAQYVPLSLGLWLYSRSLPLVLWLYYCIIVLAMVVNTHREALLLNCTITSTMSTGDALASCY